MKPFSIHNTLSRQVEELKPLNPPIVTLYSCGPTVYLPQHLGNLRAFLCWDFLRRTLELDGYQVSHVINVTDVGHMTTDEDGGEDKIEKTARAEGKSPLEIANLYLAMFQRDLAMLNAEPPEIWCRATDHIADMIALIERILAAGMAYVAPSGSTSISKNIAAIAGSESSRSKVSMNRTPGSASSIHPTRRVPTILRSGSSISRITQCNGKARGGVAIPDGTSNAPRCR